MPDNLMSAPIRRFFYGYLLRTAEAQKIVTSELTESEDIERALLVLVREAFMAGGRWQHRESSRLSPHIARFLEMCVLLGPDAPRDVWIAVDAEGRALPDGPDEVTDLFASTDEWCEHVPF